MMAQIQRLQENYCGLGMKDDLTKHPNTCNNSKFIHQFKKPPEIPNAVVYFNIHCPFLSYGDNKFVLVHADEATKITSFEANKDKTVCSLAWSTFAHWISKMAIPQVIDTNLDEDQAEDLKE